MLTLQLPIPNVATDTITIACTLSTHFVPNYTVAHLSAQVTSKSYLWPACGPQLSH